MAVARRAVDLSRTLRGQAGLKVRQPLARLWLALPGRDARRAGRAARAHPRRGQRQGRRADRRRVRARRSAASRSLLPRVGQRLGARIPAVMAAAREGAVEIQADGSVTLAGVDPGARRGRDPGDAATRARPSPTTTAWSSSSTPTLTPELRAEGDARELPASHPGPAQGGRARPRRPDRAVGRRLPADDRAVSRLRSPAETLVDELRRGVPPAERRATHAQHRARRRRPCPAGSARWSGRRDRHRRASRRPRWTACFARARRIGRRARPAEQGLDRRQPRPGRGHGRSSASWLRLVHGQNSGACSGCCRSPRRSSPSCRSA